MWYNEKRYNEGRYNEKCYNEVSEGEMEVLLILSFVGQVAMVTWYNEVMTGKAEV